MCTGFGEFTNKNMESYKGYFKDNKRHGKGLLRLPDGRTVKGIWEFDKYLGTEEDLQQKKKPKPKVEAKPFIESKPESKPEPKVERVS